MPFGGTHIIMFADPMQLLPHMTINDMNQSIENTIFYLESILMQFQWIELTSNFR